MVKFSAAALAVALVLGLSGAVRADTVGAVSTLYQKAAAAAKAAPNARLRSADGLTAAIRASSVYKVTEASAASGLTARQKPMLRSFVSKMGKTPRFDAAARKDWSALIAAGRRGAMDIDAMIAMVMKAAVADAEADLRTIAEKVRATNKKKAETRKKLADLRRKAADAKGKRAPATELNRLQALLSRTEKDLNTMGDDAQLANVDMQNSLRRVQRLLQLMSNISKQMHDTATRIVRNLKA